MKLFKKSAYFIAGILVGVMITGTVATASSLFNIQVSYDTVKKLIVNRREVVGTGEQKPFVYNGTTFIPLRLAAQALDLPVEFDAETGTAYVGDHAPYKEALTKMEIKKSYPENTLNLNEWQGINYKNNLYRYFTIAGINYKEGVAFNMLHSERQADATFLLKGQFKTLKGYIGIDDIDVKPGSEVSTVLSFYGDNALLYQSPKIYAGSAPVKVEIGVSNIEQLKIVSDTTYCKHPIFANTELRYK